LFYPLGDSVPTQTDVLAATTDGEHILGAAWTSGGVTLSDIGVTIPVAECPETTTGTTQTLSPLTIPHTLSQVPVSGVSATAVSQVVPSPNSAVAFITYNGSTPGATLPYYVPGTGGAAGTVGYVTLNGSAEVTAPLTGAFSPDGTLFFVATAGDNLIHYISIPSVVTSATPPTDSQQIAPNLPACIPVSAGGNDIGCTYTGTGSVVPTTVIEVKPRSTT
jgi:hypothetical protein